jgi:biotin operon repressor
MMRHTVKAFMSAQEVEGNARLVLFALAVDADDFGETRLSWADLINLVGLSRATISRAIAALKKDGIIDPMGAPEPGYRLPGLALLCDADRAEWVKTFEPVIRHESSDRPAQVSISNAEPADQEGVKVRLPEGATVTVPPGYQLSSGAAESLRREVERVKSEFPMAEIEMALDQWKNPTVRLAEPKPAPHVSDVRRVLEAARIQPDPREPLYWSRFEHRADLQTLLARLRIDVDELVRRLAALPAPVNVRRLLALQDHVSKKR